MPDDEGRAVDDGISVLVVDDHPVFADVLTLHLEHERGVAEVRSAYGLDEARAVARRSGPDVVLLDYHVQGAVGTSLIPDLQALPAPPEVVMLSASDDPEEVIGALASGASAWVVKGAGIDVLMHAADEVLHGRMYLSPATVRPVVTRLLRRREPPPHSFVDDLTERQLDVLRCLVSGMSRDETARRLFITTNTVRTHAQALLRAAGEHTTPALAAKARRLGVKGIDEPAAGSSG